MKSTTIPPQQRTAIRRAMLAWFRKHARDLPWRRTCDPYAIWLSEIMLQQTRIDQGTPYFERFMRALPTVQALANASDDEVLKLWEGLGYYTRARNLHKAAKQIVVERGGVFPETAEGWQSLPGVGRYTAGAIASIAFGERAAILDGNVIRVFSRLFDIAECTDDTTTKNRLWKLAEELVPNKHPGDFNQSLMELGARICTPTAPRCPECPIRRQCMARANGTVEQRPVRKAKKRVPHHEIVVAAIKKRGRYLLGKRPPNGLLGGLWEFPGGKVQQGESHATALQREVKEELGIDVSVGGLIASVNHAYSHFKVTLNVYRCELIEGTPKANSHTELKWIRPADFEGYAFPKANRKFLELL